MEKQHQLLSIILILFVLDRDILTTAVSDPPIIITDNVAFFQASSSKNQLAKSTEQAVTYTTADALNGYTIFKNGTYTYKTAGIYFGMYASQVGNPRGVGTGEVHIWTRHNGQDDADSNSIQFMEDRSTTVNAIPLVISVPVGETVSLMFSGTSHDPCGSMYLVATDFITEPLVPSIISSEMQLSSIDNPVRYTTLYSLENQLGSMTSKAITLNMQGDNNAVDATTAGADGTIVNTYSGFYFIIGSVQVGNAPNTDAEGFLDLWFELNGQAVPNSNTIQSILPMKGYSKILISQGIIKLQTNDKIKMMMSTTNENLGVISFNPTGEPASASAVYIQFELGKLDSSIPYAQFSSSISQWGCLTPTAVVLGNNDGSQSITTNNGIIKFEKSGVYFVVAAAQVGSKNGEGIGDMDLWMRLNGEDVADSNTIQWIDKTTTAVLICQTVAEFQNGDELQMMFSTRAIEGTLGIVATKPPNEPEVPSMILSIFKSPYKSN